MSASGGLTRRRGAPTGTDNAEDDTSRVSSPVPKSGAGAESRGPETSYSSGENGHKIAFDPRDISESEERNKQPKLTLMEEVLLLGLKDKQVSGVQQAFPRVISPTKALRQGLPFVLE